MLYPAQQNATTGASVHGDFIPSEGKPSLTIITIYCRTSIKANLPPPTPPTSRIANCEKFPCNIQILHSTSSMKNPVLPWAIPTPRHVGVIIFHVKPIFHHISEVESSISMENSKLSTIFALAHFYQGFYL